jgi:hypothetical protein
MAHVIIVPKIQNLTFLTNVRTFTICVRNYEILGFRLLGLAFMMQYVQERIVLEFRGFETGLWSY